MNILVCISNVPDTTTKIRFDPEMKHFDKTNVQWIINPWDELALTRAIELKENAGNSVEKVTVAHVGPPESEPTIRKALAIGADDAIRVNAEPADAYYVASRLAGAVGNGGYDIILCGIESSDYNGSAVGGMLAEFLGIPSVSAVSGLSVEGDRVRMIRDIDGGHEEVGIKSLPFLAVVQKGIAREPRIPAMRGIMMARKKPLRVVDPGESESLTETTGFSLPKEKEPCRMIDPENVKELVDLLRNEARVI